MSQFQRYAATILILLLAAALRMASLSTLPPGFSAPEIVDARLVEQIKTGRVEVLSDVGGEGREGLYHILLASITSFIGGGTFGVRIVSVWASLVTLALVYVLAARLFGDRVGLLAMLFLTINMWAVLLGRTITRESLLPLVIVAILLSLARVLPVVPGQVSRPTTAPFAVLGIIAGLGFYVHPAHYIVVLMSMAFIVYMLASRQPISRQTLSYTSFSIVVLIIILTPYLISTLRNPELGGAVRLFDEVTQISGQGIGQTILGGLGGFFLNGDPSWLRNVPGRPLMDLFSGLLVLGGVTTAILHWRQPRFALPVIALLMLLPVAVLAPDSPNFLAYSVVLPLLAIFFGIGVLEGHALMRPGWAQRGYRVLIGVLLIFNLGWTLFSMHAVWARSEPVQVAFNARTHQIARYLDETVDDIETVVCGLGMESNDLLDSESELLSLMMGRPNAGLRYADCGTGLILARGGERHQLVFLDSAIQQGVHPYLQGWVDLGTPLQRPDLPSGAVIIIDVANRLGDTIGRFTTTAPVGYAPEAPGGVEAALLPVNFGGNITFLGYDREPVETYRPGDIVTIITYWRADGVPPSDLRFFTHILFDAERIISQTDTISVDPDHLRSRDILIQVTFVQLPENLPSDTYEISIGAYQDSLPDQRLPVLFNAQPRGNRLFLNAIEVSAEE